MNDKFKDLEQVVGIMKLIPNKDILDSFIEINFERLKPLFIPKAKVVKYEKGNFCSNCGYRFKGDEDNSVYCVSCMQNLVCCDDPDCDTERERTENAVWETLHYYYSFNHF